MFEDNYTAKKRLAKRRPFKLTDKHYAAGAIILTAVIYAAIII